MIRRVYAYAAYRLGDGPDAEDVTSEVLERALRYRTTYDSSRGEPVSWLLGIARRVVAEHLTARARAQSTPAEAPDRPSDEDLAADSLRRLTLEQALEELSERDRELLSLRYGADLKARQIASVLEMETHAVEVAIGRALDRLRAVVGG